MFLENKELCYSLNVEICIVVLWHRMKKIEKRKVQRTNIFAKNAVWEKIDISSGRETQKIAQLIITKICRYNCQNFPFYIY